MEGIDDDLIAERVKRIQFLVYNFLHQIIRSAG